MSRPSIDCPNCGIPLERQSFNTPGMTACPSCSTPLHVEVYPASLGAPRTEAVSAAVEDEAGCYFHPRKKAVVACSMCGRFICSLCDIELSGSHVCPSCFEAGKKKGRIANLQNHRILYDDIALSLSIIPMILIWPTVVTAPAAIYISIRRWKSPSSIIPRTKFRYVAAILLSLLQISGWAVLISYLLTR